MGRGPLAFTRDERAHDHGSAKRAGSPRERSLGGPGRSRPPPAQRPRDADQLWLSGWLRADRACAPGRGRDLPHRERVRLLGTDRGDAADARLAQADRDLRQVRAAGRARSRARLSARVHTRARLHGNLLRRGRRAAARLRADLRPARDRAARFRAFARLPRDRPAVADLDRLPPDALRQAALDRGDRSDRDHRDHDRPRRSRRRVLEPRHRCSRRRQRFGGGGAHNLSLQARLGLRSRHASRVRRLLARRSWSGG